MHFRQIAILFLGINFNFLYLFNSAPASAFQLTLTEMTTDENIVYNDPDFTYTPNSNGFNSVTEFKVKDGSNAVQTYTIGSGSGEANFVALEANGVDVPYVIQPQGSRNLSSSTNFLLPNQEDYLSAGANGLSLSTGINKVSTQDQEIFTFPVLTIDSAKVGDNVVDILVSDVAQNQSPDRLELLDVNGNTIASLTPQSSDWQHLGKQNLERVDTATGNVSTTEGFFTQPRNVSGLALELSDFELDSGGGSLTGTEAASVTSMRISIAETPTTKPKTDYGFFAADRESVTFDRGTSNMAEVPFEFSPALGLLLIGLSVLWFKIKPKFKACLQGMKKII